MSNCINPESGTRLELAYLFGGEIISQPGDVLGPRELFDFELVYIIEGTVTYSSDGVDYTVPPGGLIFGRPGFREVYRWDPRQMTRHAYFHFSIERIPADWPELQAWPRVCTVRSPLCTCLFRRIIQQIYEHGEWAENAPNIKVCRLIETLLDTFAEARRGESASFDRERPEPVRRALLFMRGVVEENPSRKLSLADLAAEAHVTEKHLCRLFSDALGHSPMQTFTLLKLLSSRSLLLRTNLSVKEIAERCGFENPLYFSRCFSRHFGCSPTVFRRQAGAMPGNDLLPADLMPRIRW